MKERPKLRRFSKWTGAVLSVVLLLLWVTSALSHGTLVIHGHYVRYGHSCVVVYWGSQKPRKRTWEFKTAPRWLLEPLAIAWKPMWKTYLPNTHQKLTVANVPLWIPFLAVAIPTIILWRRDRRYPPGHCQECDYNLTGNVSGVCPECGTRI